MTRLLARACAEVAHVLLVRVGGGLVVIIVFVVVRRRRVVVIVVFLVVAQGRPREALEDGLLVLLRVVVRRAEGVAFVGACAGSRRVAAAGASRPARRGAPRVAAL